MMTATICPSEDRLRAFTLGQLPNEQSDELFEHLRTCEGCRAGLDTIEDSEDSLIASLRKPDELAEFSAEPDCQVAMAKALGALALASETGASSEVDELPKSIGEYEIIRMLGQGGMGNVFLARHTKLGREVALKVLAGDRLANRRTRERFEAEMRAVGRLSHPNIVTAHDAREVDGTAVLVTEFIDGFDLSQLVRRTGPLSIADACEIVRQTAVALEYTSGQGFVHRDVKPSNIMLSNVGEVKLLDLGLARLQCDENDRPEITGTGQAMGTADFVAPEQVADSRGVDVRADIYSLGCTLFKLLTGNAPFADEQHDTAFSKMTAHVSQEPPSLGKLLPDAPSSLTKLVDSMLAKHPEDRPQSPMSVAEQLAAFTSNSNLAQLAERANQLEPQTEAPRSSTVASPIQPFLHRQVSITTMIAASLGALLLGICMGVVITITYPDGTQAVIDVPPGSKIGMEKSPNGESHQAQHETPATAEIVLDGTWQVTSSKDGRLGPEQLSRLWAFHGGRYYVMEGERLISVGYYSHRQTTVPQQLDFMAGGSRSVKLGILRAFGENQIEFCLNGVPQGGRPTQFESTVGSSYVLMTLKRVEELPQVLQDAMREQQDLGDGLLEALSPPPLVADPSADKPETNQTRTEKKLKRIGLAFHNFHDVFSKFPGSMNTREGGNPSLDKKTYPFSWRVALLPFIEGQELFEQYRFDEPWDGPHNIKLLDKMPDVYRSPLAKQDQSVGHTNYQGFSGLHTALGDADGVAIKTFRDGTSNTILIAESQTSVAWTEPKDIPFEMSGTVQVEGKPLTYLMADGSVHTTELDAKELIKLITRDLGEPILK
ncbi:MAG: protein kinase [Planctomycetes bacterium]|nr:protein kinase [Planctomycetota bacterium]